MHMIIFRRHFKGIGEKISHSGALFPFYILFMEQTFHIIELPDVRFFETHSLIARISHNKERKAVTGYVVHRHFAFLSVEIYRLLKIQESEFIGAFQLTNIFKHVIVPFLKALGNVKARNYVNFSMVSLYRFNYHCSISFHLYRQSKLFPTARNTRRA